MDDPNITERAIIEHVGETFAERGADYFEEGRIAGPRLEDGHLWAHCYGSRPRPYRVEVWFGEGIERSRCTCPVRGPCKHVAALLYTWLERPETVAHPARLRGRLEQTPREELIGYLGELANRLPEARRLLELWTLEDSRDVDRETVRRQAEAAFRTAMEQTAGGRWADALGGVVAKLHELVEAGDELGACCT